MLLRDGHPVHLRPIVPEDAPALRDFHRGLSERTVYLRFFAPRPELSDADLAYFTTVDHDRRVALIALDGRRIAGVGRYDALPDGSAEVAFVVRDDMQGLGLGSILLEHLAAAARERGIREFSAEVLPDNARMLGAFRESGFLLTQHREDDVIAVRFAIEPTRDSIMVTRARELRADARSMTRLMTPECLVVVGSTDSARTARLLANLGDSFTGECSVVDSLEQVRASRADVVVVAGEVGDPITLVDSASRLGAHALVVLSGGFDDVGGVRQSELLARARSAGIRVVGPHALGIVNTDPRVRLNASLASSVPGLGGVGIFCQSAAVGDALLRRCAERGIGISGCVGVGNRGDVSGNDMLQFWRADARTSVVLLHLESMGDARKFARVAQATSGEMAVAMVRVGGAGAVLPSGHVVGDTGLGDRAVSQLLEDSGVLLVDTTEELLDVAAVVSDRELPRSAAVAVLGNSDALAAVAANAIAVEGADVGPRIVLPRLVTAEEYAAALETLRDDPSVGAVIVVYVPAFEGSILNELVDLLRADRQALALVAPAADAAHGTALGVPLFRDAAAAVRALGAASRLAAWRQARARDESAIDAIADERIAVEALGELAGVSAARLLAQASDGALLLDEDAVGTIGCRVRLLHDPLYGPVVTVGLDDPVAEALDDRAYRLAPVTEAGALRMLESLGARSVVEHAGQSLSAVAKALSRLSRSYLHIDAALEADIRHLRVSGRGEATAGEVSLVLAVDDGDSALVRRMRRVE